MAIKPGFSSSITLLEYDDVDEIVDLSQQFFPRSREYTRDKSRKRFLELYFDQTDLLPNCAPIVCKTESGQIIGFLGVIYSSFTFKEKRLTVANCHHLVATALGRQQMVPIKLLQHFLAGPQDISFADGSSNATKILWGRLGGEPVLSESVYYNIPLRPFSFAMRVLLAAKTDSLFKKIITGASKTLDSLAYHAKIPLFYRKHPDQSLTDLSVDVLLELTQEVRPNYQLFPEYTEQFLINRLKLLENETRFGSLQKIVMMDESASAVGWFIYFAQKGGVCEVIQAVSLPGYELELHTALTWHAHSLGGVEISGRLMRNLLYTPFTTKSISLPARMWTLIKCDDLSLKHSIQSGSAFLTRLDGDLWVL